MKSKLISLFTTLVLTLSSLTLLAQPGAGGGGGMGMGNPEARVAELIATLEITSQQEAAFRAAMGKVNELQMSAMRAMMANGGGGTGQSGGMAMNMERRAELQRQAEEILAPVLTETQMVKYREAEEARMAQMRERMMQRGQ